MSTRKELLSAIYRGYFGSDDIPEMLSDYEDQLAKSKINEGRQDVLDKFNQLYTKYIDIEHETISEQLLSSFYNEFKQLLFSLEDQK